MKVYVFTSFLLLAAVFQHMEGAAQKPKRISMEERNALPCKAGVSYLMKQIMGGLGTCTRKLKFKNQKERAQKVNCVFKCLFSDEGILDKDGNTNLDMIEAFLEREFPTKFLLLAKGATLTCIYMPAISGGLDPSDPLCRSYGPAANCLQAEIESFCDKNPEIQ